MRFAGHILKVGRTWAIEVPILGVVTQGRTKKEAFAMIADGRYDVAVVDMVLPGPSGVEVIRKFKSISPATRIIICTAYDSSELLAEAQTLGVDRTVHKPADPAALIALIKKLADPLAPNENKL